MTENLNGTSNISFKEVLEQTPSSQQPDKTTLTQESPVLLDDRKASVPIPTEQLLSMALNIDGRYPLETTTWAKELCTQLQISDRINQKLQSHLDKVKADLIQVVQLANETDRQNAIATINAFALELSLQTHKWQKPRTTT